ncbi:Uncharacterised protein [uncultured archaeon]|nr:Uncharacterised protein [uncultured archaeon]
MQRLSSFLVLSLAFILLLGGCVQTGTPSVQIQTGQQNTSLLPASNASANPSNASGAAPNSNSTPAVSNSSSSMPNSSSNSTLEQASERLLAINKLFLNQTQAGSDAAAALQFGDAAQLLNLSAHSAALLTANLAQVCELKGVNCTSQLNGYAQISLCARQRALFYWQVETLMPVVQTKLNCTAAENETNSTPSASCSSNDALYADACTALLAQANFTRAACLPVMPDINVVESSQLLCAEAANSSS